MEKGTRSGRGGSFWVGEVAFPDWSGGKAFAKAARVRSAQQREYGRQSGVPRAGQVRRRAIGDGPPGGLYDPSLQATNFWVLFGLILFGVGAGAATSQPGVSEDARTVLWVLVGFATAALVGLTFIYFSRAWTMMRALRIHRPGKKYAVLMALPIVNMVMAPVAVLGWAKLWNTQQKIHPGLHGARPVSKFIFGLFCLVLPVVQLGGLAWLAIHLAEATNPAWLPAALSAAAAVLLALGLIVMYQMCRSVNYLTVKKS